MSSLVCQDQVFNLNDSISITASDQLWSIDIAIKSNIASSFDLYGIDAADNEYFMRNIAISTSLITNVNTSFSKFKLYCRTLLVTATIFYSCT